MSSDNGTESAASHQPSGAAQRNEEQGPPQRDQIWSHEQQDTEPTERGGHTQQISQEEQQKDKQHSCNREQRW